jgi:phasin family protein
MTKPTTSPVFEADISKLMDPSKVMAGFKVPGLDTNALMQIQRKNIEAMTAVSQAVLENLQSFAQRQAELMRLGFEETTSLIKAVMLAPTMQEKIACQAEASKAAVAKCMATGHDAAETLAKCNSHAMETVSNRMNEGMEELRDLIKTNVAA